MSITDEKLNQNIKTVYLFDHIEETTADGNAYMAEAHSFTLFLLLFWFK